MEIGFKILSHSVRYGMYVAMQSYFYLRARIDICCMNWKELCIGMKTQKIIFEIGSKVKQLWMLNMYTVGNSL